MKTTTAVLYEQTENGPEPMAFEMPRISYREFVRLCQRHPNLRVERTHEGKLIFMPPAEAEGDSRNTAITTLLTLWSWSLPEPGKTFGPSAGFTLPSGATRSPDAAWISAERWNALTATERRGFAHICPDFVVELLSPSHSLTETQLKLTEYVANGARLGLLIDRKRKVVEVYRPEQPTQTLNNPAHISCDPELPGFTLSLERVF
jgi:Uma2 family endonuclease